MNALHTERTVSQVLCMLVPSHDIYNITPSLSASARTDHSKNSERLIGSVCSLAGTVTSPCMYTGQELQLNFTFNNMDFKIPTCYATYRLVTPCFAVTRRQLLR
jgi:hypothetical protein